VATNALPSLDKSLMRAINRHKVLYTIRNRGLISRADISRSTGLSPASITSITAQLIKEDLLLEKQSGDSFVGRRPILLALNPEGAFTLGVFLSVQRISVVIINLQADVLAKFSMPFEEKDTSPESIADTIMQAIHQCMWSTKLSKNEISGVGVAVPGVIDSITGLIRFLPNYQWKSVNFKEILLQKLQIPIHIDNSANSLTLTEQWFGKGQDVDNFIVVNLAHGVGIGIVINGQLYMGHSGIAGEFGHTVIDASGPSCRCGKRGCLEAYVGNYAILKNARELVRDGDWSTDSPEDLTIEDVISRAFSGEELLIDLYAEAGRILGIGIANLIEIFDPEKIIISGKGTNAGRLIFDSMYKTIPEHISGDTDDRTEVIVQEWKDTDTARGAGMLVLRDIYKLPSAQTVQKSKGREKQ
jgi:predicted NBD/HSP70 family sugar kinase